MGNSGAVWNNHGPGERVREREKERERERLGLQYPSKLGSVLIL